MLSVTIATHAAAAVFGALVWSFAEYAIHNWLGHKHPRNAFGKEHTDHHRIGDYFAPTSHKAVTAGVIILPLVALLAWLAGTIGIAAIVGFTLAYVGYELLHRRCHTHPPISAYGRWARKHHFAHHFMYARSNFGVTSPIWDIVFRTHRPVSRVRVPRQKLMDWLVDTETGDIRPEHAEDYELLRRG